MMDELVVAATAFFREGAEYYRRQNHPLLPLATEPAAEVDKGVWGTADVKVEKKERKARTPKVEAPQPTASTATPPTMTEDESAVKLRDIGNKYVERYSQSQPSGADRLRKLIAEVQPGTVKLSQLSHESRIAVIGKMMGELG